MYWFLRWQKVTCNKYVINMCYQNDLLKVPLNRVLIIIFFVVVTTVPWGTVLVDQCWTLSMLYVSENAAFS